jgi:hypothetical protein
MLQSVPDVNLGSHVSASYFLLGQAPHSGHLSRVRLDVDWLPRTALDLAYKSMSSVAMLG